MRPFVVAFPPYFQEAVLKWFSQAHPRQQLSTQGTARPGECLLKESWVIPLNSVLNLEKEK